MIKTKEDLKFYIREDSKVNIGKESCGIIEYWFRVWYGDERYCFLSYMKSLRYLEYTTNCLSGPVGKIIKALARIRWRRLCVKYSVIVNPNIVGYGLRMPHLVGG